LRIYRRLAVGPINGSTTELAHFENIPFGLDATSGDYNVSGAVDAADFIVWRDMLTQIGAGLAADGNGDQNVDAGDYDVWRANFGKTASDVAALSVQIPEPGSAALIAFAASLLVVLRRCFH
jgi:hypothetical protein